MGHPYCQASHRLPSYLTLIENVKYMVHPHCCICSASRIYLHRSDNRTSCSIWRCQLERKSLVSTGSIRPNCPFPDLHFATFPKSGDRLAAGAVKLAVPQARRYKNRTELLLQLQVHSRAGQQAFVLDPLAMTQHAPKQLLPIQLVQVTLACVQYALHNHFPQSISPKCACSDPPPVIMLRAV